MYSNKYVASKLSSTSLDLFHGVTFHLPAEDKEPKHRDSEYNILVEETESPSALHA